MTFLIIWSYIKQWNLGADFFHWPLEIRISELLVEFIYDILAIGYLVSIHHRNFKSKAKKRRRFVSKREHITTNEDEYDYDEEDDGEPSVEHVSIYEDSETDMASGTVE